jgi:crotonobetainyl-CoA:carnitine CoA-transferase CaiB-like acyl-CoA transferase
MLEGMSVIELGASVALSSAGAVFRLLGADVTKIASIEIQSVTPQERDLMEILDRGVIVEASGHSDTETLVREASTADIVMADLTALGIEPVSPSGISYSNAVKVYNRASWVSITPFGMTGPYANCRPSELVLTAAGGPSAYMRNAEGRPMKPAGYTASVASGLFAALAGLHGHLLTRRHGSGPVHLDLSLRDTVVVSSVFLECAHLLFSAAGKGGTGRYAAPRGLAACKDGLISICVLEDHQWNNLMAVMGFPEWAMKIQGLEARRAQSPDVQRHFEEWSKNLTVTDCMKRLQMAGVPATAVNSCADLLSDDELKNRGFFKVLPSGERVPGLPAVLYDRQKVSQSVERQIIPSSVETTNERMDREAVAKRRPRIVDLCQVLAAPLATSWLATMGFDVVKIEDPARTDAYRRGGPFADGIRDIEHSAYFSAANYSKRSVALDLKSSDGLQILSQLVSVSDFIVENLSEHRANLLLPTEVGEPELHARVVSSSGFGRVKSSRSNWKAYGHNIHSFGGLVDLSRDRTGLPRDVGTAWADPLTAIWIALIVIAQYMMPENQRSDIDISMAEVVAYQFAEQLVRFQRTGAESRSDESRLEGYAPHGIFCCAGEDEWLAVAVRDDCEWRALVRALGSPPSLVTQDYETYESRAAAQDMLESALDQVLAHENRDAIFKRLQEAGVRCAPVRDAQGLIDDIQLRHRRLFQAPVHPLYGPRGMAGLPWVLADGGPFPIIHSPTLGEHTDEVIGEWLADPNRFGRENGGL